MAKKKLPKVTSLAHLRALARTDSRYAELALAAARNLGGNPASLDRAFAWLGVNADETTEAGVVAEINFCRGLEGEPEPAVSGETFNRDGRLIRVTIPAREPKGGAK